MKTLDDVVADYVRKGYRVESKDRNQAVLVKGRRVNHWAHGIATVCTFGFWSPIWLIRAVAGGEKRQVLTEDRANGTIRVAGKDGPS